MAFKKDFARKELAELVAMTDVIFMLIIYFLITSSTVQRPGAEDIKQVVVPTPENRPGWAQVVVQIIDEERVLWMDARDTTIIQRILDDEGFLPPNELNGKIMDAIIRAKSISYERLDVEFERLRREAEAKPALGYFLLIRCPNSLPYEKAIQVIAKLSEIKETNAKIHYGCVAGSVDDLRNSESIRLDVEPDRQGAYRRVIRIDFSGG